MKTPTKEETKRAMDALQKLKFLVKQDRISLDAAKEFSKPHVATWDAYNKASSCKAGVSFRKFSFSGFIR